LKVPAAALYVTIKDKAAGIFSLEYDFILSSLANPAAS